MEKQHNKIEANVIVLSTRHSVFYGLALFLSLSLTCFVFTLLYINNVPFSFEVIISVITLFLLFFVGCILIKVEYLIYTKNNYTSKPPLQLIFSIAVVLLYAFFGIRAIETLQLDERYFPYITITIISILIGGSLKLLFAGVFLLILRLFDRVKRHQILSYSDFTTEMDHKIHDFKRYKNSFSFILFSIWVNEKYREKLARIVEYSYFFEIIRRNIRKNDLLGLSKVGDHALILSMNNDHAKATHHAERIAKILSEDAILKKMFSITPPKYKFVIEEAKIDSEESRAIIKKAERDLQKACDECDSAFRADIEAKGQEALEEQEKK